MALFTGVVRVGALRYPERHEEYFEVFYVGSALPGKKG